MNIGIMGGTFDPIHSAHLLIAEMAREEFNLHRVVFMTGGNPPHKTDITPSSMRFQMTRLAISDNPYFADDDYETKKTEKSYTVRTLEYLKDKYPEDELFFIIGEDSLKDFPMWYKPEEILKMCTLLVFPRTSHSALADTLNEMRIKYGDNILPINAPIMEISSTEIRDRIGKGKTVKYMLPDKVIEYIKENNLYGKRD
ncbi:MAG: nicotinate-nucleotide adenylyltransferase [Oscillospiraceae bacterium]|nr:nicotinate-nucleotide adenylyltransferase [Oscillospiraceae bacterium]